MDATESSKRPLVVCALEYERESLRRAGIEGLSEVLCVGPGAPAVVRWAELLGETSRPVILAGLAGSLRASFPVGATALIATVIDADERSFRAPLLFERGFVAAAGSAGHIMHQNEADVARSTRAVIASSRTILTTPGAKAAFAAKTGADLVDLESGAFALAASILGWRWAIVKGVSDDLDASLPGDIDRWVDEAGRTIAGRVAISTLLRPWQMPGMARLKRGSGAAMAGVAHLLRGMLSLMDRATRDANEPS